MFEHSILHLKDYGNVSYGYSDFFANTGTTVLQNLGLLYGAQQQKEYKTMDTNKRGLYQVIIVNPKTEEVVLNTTVLADKLEDVFIVADLSTILKVENLKVADVDKIVNFLGEVRKTRKNKDGEIEII